MGVTFADADQLINVLAADASCAAEAGRAPEKLNAANMPNVSERNRHGCWRMGSNGRHAESAAVDLDSGRSTWSEEQHREGKGRYAKTHCFRIHVAGRGDAGPGRQRRGVDA